MFFVQVEKIRRFFAVIPLSWRLALTAFVVSMVILTFLSGLFRYVINARLSEEYQINLANHISEMHDIIKEVQLQHTSNPTSDKWIEAELQNWPYYTRLITDKGEIIGETAGMPFDMAELYSIIPDDKENVTYRSLEGRPYTLVKSSVYDGISFLGQVQVVRDITPEDIGRRKITDIFTWISVLGSFLTGFCTLLIADGALKPIRRMTEAIKNISFARLNYRLKRAIWPRELRPIAMAFDGMLDRLEDNFKRLSQFSSDLAHELRTPAHKMMVEIDVTLSAERTASEYKAVLESLQDSVARTNKMLEDMLFIARAENKVAAVKLVNIDIQKEILKLTDFLQILLDEKDLKFDINVSGKVKADEAMFMRAMSNLINNAVRYSSRGGIIKIISTYEDKNFIISVVDSGDGIKQEDVNKVFDRFFKADRVRTSEEDAQIAKGGSGLGLAIVHSIMIMHNGSISAVNVPGGGAKFSLIFPLK